MAVFHCHGAVPAPLSAQSVAVLPVSSFVDASPVHRDIFEKFAVLIRGLEISRVI